MAHTPEPWQVGGVTDTLIHSKATGVLIASACGIDDSGYFPTVAEAIANAKLIAAAPDLLRLLRQLHDMCNGYVKGHRDEYLASKSEAHELLNRLGG